MARINGNNSANTLRGTAYNDVIQGFGGNDRLNGLRGNDVLYGGDGSDIIYGGDGNDTLYGGNGNDRIYGGDNADVLNGGGGADLMWGGSGGDGFAITNLFDDGGQVGAFIMDFSRAQGDYINLSGIDGNARVSGNQALTWRGYDANGGPANEGADRAGVSYTHAIVDGEWWTIVNVRNLDDAGYNNAGNFTQIWVDGKINLTPGDFIF